MWVFSLEPESDGIDVNPGLILLTFSNAENFVPWVDSILFFHFSRHTSVDTREFTYIKKLPPKFHDSWVMT